MSHKGIEDALLTKAKSSALLATEIYNRPTADFRVQTFILLMHVAWTSLLLAVFHQQSKDPFYKDAHGSYEKTFERDRKAWDLTRCIKEYWGGRTTAKKKNLEFFVRLRNRIQHYTSQEALAAVTFGECQSMVFNFEEILTREFGKEAALGEAASLTIQLSQKRSKRKEQSLRELLKDDHLAGFISSFRSSLSDNIYRDLDYSYQVFLLPKIHGRKSRDAVAIDWMNWDEMSDAEREHASRTLALIKEKRVHVRLKGGLLPKEVSRRVRESLGLEKFHHSSHHAYCWRYFGVRPEKGEEDPTRTDGRYCIYDPVHHSYVYTRAWVEKLIKELSNQDTRNEILGDV